MNDSKYHTGPITNTATGGVIPADEPVFFFRGKDLYAVVILEFYWELIEDPEHKREVKRRIDEFYAFRNKEGSPMKFPDTDSSNQGKFIG